MSFFMSEWGLTTGIDIELWSQGAEIVPLHKGIRQWEDGDRYDTWEYDMFRPSGGGIGAGQVGFKVQSGGGNAPGPTANGGAAPPANANVVAFQWVDADGNFVALVSGFSIKYSDFIAGASNPDPNQRYAFWSSLLNGNDTIVGGTINDIIEVGTGGKATIASGEGNDHVYVWHQKNIVYDGGSGIDAIVFDSQFGPPGSLLSGLTINLTTGTGTNPYGGTVKLTNVEDVTGTSQNDNITGNAANNKLGAFFVDGNFYNIGGNDRMRGLAGDDTIGFSPNAGEKIVLADGGAGTDELRVYVSGQAVGSHHILDLVTPAKSTGVFAGASIAGFEIYSVGDFGAGQMSFEFRGTAVAETVSGTGAGDTLNGNAGNDTLTGFAGLDKLNGGVGNDTLVGADSGPDHFDGGSGVDKAVIGRQSSALNLTLSIATPSVKMTMADGTTVINVEQLDYIGGSGRDTITGGVLTDDLSGNGGNDILNGNSGDDILNGDLGVDAVNGGAGNDQFITFDGEGADKIDGGTGIDAIAIIRSGQAAALTVSLATPGVKQIGQGSTMVNVERFSSFAAGSGNDRITGGAFDDNVSGDSGNDILVGNNGNDSLNGGVGNDNLNGGNGGDTLLAGSGKDQVDGGSGIDFATFDRAAFTGVLTVDLTNAAINHALADGSNFIRVERITFLSGTRNDTLTGGALDDVLGGNGGNDKLNGAGGNDFLSGGLGSDAMAGGTGDDIYLVDATGDVVTETAGQGIDTVNATINHVLRVNVENLTLTGNANNATGNTLANVLAGNARANGLNGLAGNDTLNGGDGKDVMAGGAGKDTFVFNTAPNVATNVDRITDFNVADDLIKLENDVFTALQTAATTLAAPAFFKGAAAHDINDRIIYNGVTGALIYDSNGSLAGGATQFATLAKNLALTNADFVVI